MRVDVVAAALAAAVAAVLAAGLADLAVRAW